MSRIIYHQNIWNKNLGLTKEFIEVQYCYPVYLTYIAEYIIQNAALDDSQAEIKIARRNINNFRYADDTTFIAEVKKN